MNAQKSQPKRFSTDHWQAVRLDEVAEIVGGGTPSTKEPSFWDGNIPWITPKDLSNHQSVYIKDGERKITKEGLRNSSAKLLPTNSILFSSRAPVGYVAINKAPVATNQGFKSLVPREGFDYRFLYYLLLKNKDTIEAQASGSTFSEVSGSVMKSIEVKIPITLEEQKEIAEMLGVFDDKIELLRAQNETLENMAQTLFREWFVEFNFPDKNGQPYKKSGGKMIDSELGLIPEGWSVGRLGEEFDISIGRTPPRAETGWFSKKPIGKKWISIKDMVNSGVYIFNSSEYLTEEAIKKFNIPVIPNNTTILSFKMTVGKLAITTDDMLSNEAIAHLKVKKDSSLSSEFIYSYLQSLDFNKLGSTSSIVTAINSTMIKSLELLVPSKETLQGFNDVVSPFFKKIKNNTIEIQTLSRVRGGLLNEIFK